MKVLLAEKPSVARELAAYLGAMQRRDGYFEGRGYQVTWALGHLATLKEPQDYDPALKAWSLSALPIIPERFELKAVSDRGAGKQLSVVKRFFRAADEIICATDAGREGELIFRYILELSGCRSKPARRLWLSSLTEAAIREAFSRLRPLADYDDLYAAARCRSEADWVVGLNATRYYTVRHRTPGILWSVGRVQTPVLSMIVHRDDEIRTFKPEPFWELLTRYREVTFKFAGDRFAREEDARGVLECVRGHPFTVKAVETKPERAEPPQLYDLTELQRDMNRRYGMSADATLKAAQSHYEGKLLSYPRTDSRYLGSDMKEKVPGVLRALHAMRPDEIGRLDLKALRFSGRIINDRRVSDHHAIIPTGTLPGELSPLLRKVFDAVVTRLIAAFYPPCVKEVTTVSGLSNGVPFRARGVRVLDPGWTALYPRNRADSQEDEPELPEFKTGESGPHEPSVRRGETSPPKPFTEGTLLGAMETAGKFVDDEGLKEALKARGLGTPATRASIIETLLERGYIAREKKAIVATDLGRYLVALVRERGLKSPELTGEWESKLREIERGRLDPRQFMGEIARFTGDIIRSGDGAAVDPNRLGECPRCGRPVIEGKKGFGCSGWREGCRFVLWPESQGRSLGVAEVRELLQLGSLSRPISGEGAGEVLLYLTNTGEIAEVSVPTGRPRKPIDQTGRKPSIRRKGTATGRREPIAGETPATPAREPPSGFGAVALGRCPRCGAEVVEQLKSFGCSGWKGGCRFAIWKKIAGRTIGVRTAQSLLREGRTAVLKGFESKAGKRFEARLTIEAGEVRFEFAT
jgi:DNA topoisomerase-3